MLARAPLLKGDCTRLCPMGCHSWCVQGLLPPAPPAWAEEQSPCSFTYQQISCCCGLKNRMACSTGRKARLVCICCKMMHLQVDEKLCIPATSSVCNIAKSSVHLASGQLQQQLRLCISLISQTRGPHFLSAPDLKHDISEPMTSLQVGHKKLAACRAVLWSPGIEANHLLVTGV